MKIIDIFEKVNLTVPIEQRDFLNYVEDTIHELSSMYGEKFIFSGDDYKFTSPDSINEEIPVHEHYKKAIAENVLFLAGAGDVHQHEFIRQSRDAYLRYWNEDAKDRKLRRNRW